MFGGRSVKYEPSDRLRAPPDVRQRPQPPVHPFCEPTPHAMVAALLIFHRPSTPPCCCSTAVQDEIR